MRHDVHRAYPVAMAAPAAPSETLFSALPADLSSGLFGHARPVRLAANQVLFLAGDPGDGCYRVDEGLLKVTVVSPSGGERILAILGPGTLVGELSVIDGAPRSASVTAIRESKLAFVSRAAFDAFAQANPEVYRPLTMLLARRLRDIDGGERQPYLAGLEAPVARESARRLLLSRAEVRARARSGYLISLFGASAPRCIRGRE